MPLGQRLNPFKPKQNETANLSLEANPPTSESFPYGLATFIEGVNSVLDIVAVHGLNGHREKTWTLNDINWLRDLLPTVIPNARILSWGYDANTHSTSPISAQYLYDHARTLVSDLVLERKLTKTQTRPIIFVAHSLGGLVVKSALIHSEAARKGALEEQRSIKVSTYGIIFMGTPHQGGSGVHFGKLLLNVASIFVTADNNLLKHLERDSEWLQQQLGQYAPISGDFVTKFAYETYPTPIALGRTIMVVPKASAVVSGAADAEPVAIPANHINMVKFSSDKDEGYKKISGHLQLLAEDAPDAISTRWGEEDRIKKVQIIAQDFSVPFSLSGVPEADQFIGRGEELIQLEEAFQGDGSQRQIVLLHGLGGIGKTQLAVAFMRRRRDSHSAIFWLNGKNEGTLKQSFAGIAKRLYNTYPSSALLRTATEEKDINQVVALILQWLSIRGNHRWMLVFDNVDNPRLPGVKDPQAYDIKSYFPEAHQGSILITTRSSRLKIGKVVPIKKLLDPRECITILASTSGRAISDQDPPAIKLASQLDGLPLALATAGAYLSQVATSLEDYLRHYRTSWLKLQQTTPTLLSYEDRALYTTWNISFEHIASQNESAGKLLQLWAYFDNHDVWSELLAAGLEDCPEWFSKIIDDELSFNAAIRLLCDHALVEPLQASGGYSMHTCVHAWAMHVLNTGIQSPMARLALICVGSAAPTINVPEYWAVQRRLLPHADRCLELIRGGINLEAQDDQKTLDAVGNLGDLYRELGELVSAEFMCGRALEGYESLEALGLEHTSILSTLDSLGNVFVDQGKLAAAEAMFQRALEGYENLEAQGLDHISTLSIVNNLGTVYRDQGKLAAAEAMYQRALKGKEEVFGLEHPSTLNTANNLGNVYNDQGKLAAAEAMYQRALQGNEKLLGPEHISTLAAVGNLGSVYEAQGKLTAAEAMYRRAIEGTEKALGPEHTQTLKSICNLGRFYTDQGKSAFAEALYLQALEGFKKALGPEHTEIFKTVGSLGRLYAVQSKPALAEAMYLQALEGFKNTLGSEHPSTLGILNNLGRLYGEGDKPAEAEGMWRQVLEGYVKAYGPEHPSTVIVASNLKFLYTRDHNPADAKVLWERALEDCKVKARDG